LAPQVGQKRLSAATSLPQPQQRVDGMGAPEFYQSPAEYTVSTAGAITLSCPEHNE